MLCNMPVTPKFYRKPWFSQRSKLAVQGPPSKPILIYNRHFQLKIANVNFWFPTNISPAVPMIPQFTSSRNKQSPLRHYLPIYCCFPSYTHDPSNVKHVLTYLVRHGLSYHFLFLLVSYFLVMELLIMWLLCVCANRPSVYLFLF